MFWTLLVAFHLVSTDVIRDNGFYDYEGQFTVTNKGRMLRVLMYFNNIQQEECALHCVRHLKCRTFNYHNKKNDCELTDEDFNEMNVDIISRGWYNHGTPPKVNGGWSTWRNFTDCTKTCGNGSLEQWRDCDSPKPEYGGDDCRGRMRRTVDCNTFECPVNGGWSTWMNSTTCSKECGNGTLEQARFCNSPKPDHGGANCTGRMRRNVTCNAHECKLVNVALDKQAKQSSTIHSNVLSYGPSKAVDGNILSRILTERDSKPWWYVDMGQLRVIKRIHLNAKVGANNKALMVETWENEGNHWTSCKYIGDVVEKITKVECDKQFTKTQWLKIKGTKSGRLEIFEVEIFGY